MNPNAMMYINMLDTQVQRFSQINWCNKINLQSPPCTQKYMAQSGKLDRSRVNKNKIFYC